MKYYKNLIKRKKYKVLICSLILFLLGLYCFCFNSSDIINNGIGSTNINEYTAVNSGPIGLIGTNNIGLAIIGILVMYTGLIFLPVSSPYAQDDSEYDIKSRNKYVYIRFKKNEFLVEKETFQPTSLFFRDKNNRFVSITRGYQIYNYTMEHYKKLTEKELDNSKTILKYEVVSKFSNVRKMTNEEKNKFIDSQRIKNRPRFLFIITSFILWISFAFWTFGLLVTIINNNFTIPDIIVTPIMLVASFVLGKKSNKAIFKNKKLIKKILNEDMFIVNAKIYDKKHIQSQDTDFTVHDDYYIKITDGNYIVDQWIEIPEEKYEQNSNDVKFYVFDKTGNEYFLIF